MLQKLKVARRGRFFASGCILHQKPNLARWACNSWQMSVKAASIRDGSLWRCPICAESGKTVKPRDPCDGPPPPVARLNVSLLPACHRVPRREASCRRRRRDLSGGRPMNGSRRTGGGCRVGPRLPRESWRQIQLRPAVDERDRRETVPLASGESSTSVSFRQRDADANAPPLRTGGRATKKRTVKWRRRRIRQPDMFIAALYVRDFSLNSHSVKNLVYGYIYALYAVFIVRLVQCTVIEHLSKSNKVAVKRLLFRSKKETVSMYLSRYHAVSRQLVL